jgi:AraC-like DNA-binding protein
LQTWFHARGTTFTDYLLEQRLNFAERQLVSTARKATVSEIAYAVGFSDLSYFSRCFRRRFGITASDLRAAGHRKG